MSAVFASCERHLLNVGCVCKLGATFTKCRLFASFDGRHKCRLLMIDSQAVFSKYQLFHEKVGFRTNVAPHSDHLLVKQPASNIHGMRVHGTHFFFHHRYQCADH